MGLISDALKKAEEERRKRAEDAHVQTDEDAVAPLAPDLRKQQPRCQVAS